MALRQRQRHRAKSLLVEEKLRQMEAHGVFTDQLPGTST